MGEIFISRRGDNPLAPSLVPLDPSSVSFILDELFDGECVSRLYDLSFSRLGVPSFLFDGDTLVVVALLTLMHPSWQTNS